MTLAAARQPEFPAIDLVRRHPFVAALTLVTCAMHLALAGRYDIMRNELYFIVCGWRPAFGYVDQPPLAPLIAAATQMFGESVWLLRLPAALAATALVPLTAAFARFLGGDRTSAILAAAGAALSPALMGMTTTTTTSTFEPICWTLCAFFLTRGVAREDWRALLSAGIVAGLAMETKYGVAVWLLGLGAGLLATRLRLFATPGFWFAAAVGGLIAAPSLVWQSLHGLPFLEVIGHHNSAKTIFTGTPLEFAAVQIVSINIALAPLWIVGVVAPFVSERLAPARFLSRCCWRRSPCRYSIRPTWRHIWLRRICGRRPTRPPPSARR
jgi:4-amino-4-deoxy-L-arabinose transferase-like glycosyltransferase